MNRSVPFRLGIMRMRSALAPYRRSLSLVILPILLVPLANSALGWNLFGDLDRKAFGVALLLGLVWFVLVAPTHVELDELRERKRRSAKS
jgi:hypothetical protein